MSQARTFLPCCAPLLLTVVVLAVSGCGTNEYVPAPPREVEVANPVDQTITRRLEFTGTTEAYEKVDIQARVAGFLTEIKFTPGSDVEKGDLLFVIDQQPFQVRVDEAQAAVAMAEAQEQSALAQEASAIAERRNAQLQLDRNRAAAAGGAVTQAEIDQLEAAYSVAEASILAARAAKESAAAQKTAAVAALRDAELDLTYTEVRSPIAGRVGRNLVDVGNLVGANETTHLTTVIRYDPIYAYYPISESVLLQWIQWQEEGKVASSDALEEMRRKKVYLALSNEQGFPHEGHFDFADLAVDQSSGTFMVRAVFENPGRQIPPGSFVRIQVPLFPEEVLLVDDAAIGRDQAGAYVLVVGPDDTVERRGIEVGERYQGMRVVDAGLTTEDSVVVSGLQFARPGGKVKPNMTEMTSPVVADETSNFEENANPSDSSPSAPSEG